MASDGHESGLASWAQGHEGGTAMRSHEVIEGQYNAAVHEATEQPDAAGFAQGVAAGLAWILGKTDVGPISGMVQVWPAPADVATEHGLAEAILTGQRAPADGVPRTQTAGIEHALMWAAGRSIQTPIASDDVDLRTRMEMQDELARVRGAQHNPGFSPAELDQLTGSVETLEWVLGVKVVAPLSAKVHDQAPGVEAIEDESDLADALRFGGTAPVGARPVTRDFAAGVDQCLRWVLSQTERSAL